MAGTLKGWIAQDKTGAGFVGPVVTQPVCDPSRGPCTTQPVCDPSKGPCNTQPVCDPSRGPCTTQPVCDPAKGPCTTQPVNTFARTFMAGTVVFKQYLERAAIKPGDYFYVSIQGMVFRVLNDSIHLTNAKAPMCNQVVFLAEAIPAKSDSAHHKAAAEKDAMFLKAFPASNLVFAIEDQFMAGNPARMDKARDNQGEIRSNVFVAESRPVPPDYGTSAMVCPINNGPIVNQPCDPTKGFCPPVDTAKCDPTRMTCTQPCDPNRADCLPVCDPSKGPCGPTTGGFKAPIYMGPMETVKMALLASQNQVGIVKDSSMFVSGKITINAGSLFFDQNTRMTLVADLSGTGKFIVLAEPNDPMKLLVRDGVPLVFPKPMDGGNPPVGDTTKPIVTNPPVGDSTKPVAYKGGIETIKSILTSKNWMAKLATPQGPISIEVDDGSLKTDGTITTFGEVGNPTRIFVVMGDKMDPYKPALTASGDLLVMEKPVTAGP